MTVETKTPENQPPDEFEKVRMGLSKKSRDKLEKMEAGAGDDEVSLKLLEEFKKDLIETARREAEKSKNPEDDPSGKEAAEKRAEVKKKEAKDLALQEAERKALEDANKELDDLPEDQEPAPDSASASADVVQKVKKASENTWWDSVKSGGKVAGKGVLYTGAAATLVPAYVGYKAVEKTTKAAWRMTKLTGKLIWDIGGLLAAGKWQMEGSDSFKGYFKDYYKTLRPEEKEDKKNR